ncbi:MAG: HD domain-containing protein [Chloroflexota bacterium]|nr:MAG: HD domain-containing protein [Chloroflexota bacterium]
MRRIFLDQVSDGLLLGRTLYNERGDVLLRHGTTLTTRYRDLLREKGFISLYVCDGDDDLAPDDIVSEHVRSNATRGIHRFLETIENAARDPSSRSKRPAALVESTDLRRALGGSLEKIHAVIETIIDEVIQASALTGLTALKTHDNYTFCHSIDVTISAIMIGKRMHFDRAALRDLALGCILHDTGKIFVSKAILTKPDRLTPEEFAAVKQHPGLGYKLLHRLQREEYFANHVAYQHHERQDGAGYPRGLRGSNRVARDAVRGTGYMLLIAEIAAVADVYDALSSDRPYRPGMAPDQVVQTIRSMAGPHLNREIVASFLSVVPSYPLGISVRFTAGPFIGCLGTVLKLNRAIDRPLVRVTRDRHGHQIAAREIDLSVEPAHAIASVLHQEDMRRAS